MTADRFCREDLPDIVPHIIREEAEQAVREIMQDFKAGSLFKTEKARAIIEKIINQLIKNRHVAGKLADIRILDDYTFSYSVNVCIFAISTGVFMGYSKIRLRELGIGALLHDVGKTKIVVIVDVYDALRADRIYKNAILPYEAMEIIIASGVKIIKDAQGNEIDNGAEII